MNSIRWLEFHRHNINNLAASALDMAAGFDDIVVAR
jgi:hypothetical protein